MAERHYLFAIENQARPYICFLRGEKVKYKSQRKENPGTTIKGPLVEESSVIFDT